MLRDLREGGADLAVWLSATGPVQDARHYWSEPLVWMHSPATRINLAGPVALVSYGDECVCTRSAIVTLGDAGRDCEQTFVGSSLLGISAAVSAGFGVMVLPRSRANLPGLSIWEDAPLPELPEIFCGICVRAGTDSEEREEIADELTSSLHPQISPGQLGIQSQVVTTETAAE